MDELWHVWKYGREHYQARQTWQCYPRLVNALLTLERVQIKFLTYWTSVGKRANNYLSVIRKIQKPFDSLLVLKCLVGNWACEHNFPCTLFQPNSIIRTGAVAFARTKRSAASASFSVVQSRLGTLTRLGMGPTWASTMQLQSVDCTEEIWQKRYGDQGNNALFGQCQKSSHCFGCFDRDWQYLEVHTQELTFWCSARRL